MGKCDHPLVRSLGTFLVIRRNGKFAVIPEGSGPIRWIDAVLDATRYGTDPAGLAFAKSFAEAANAEVVYCAAVECIS